MMRILPVLFACMLFILPVLAYTGSYTKLVNGSDTSEFTSISLSKGWNLLGNMVGSLRSSGYFSKELCSNKTIMDSIKSQVQERFGTVPEVLNVACSDLCVVDDIKVSWYYSTYQKKYLPTMWEPHCDNGICQLSETSGQGSIGQKYFDDWQKEGEGFSYLTDYMLAFYAYTQQTGSRWVYVSRPCVLLSTQMNMIDKNAGEPGLEPNRDDRGKYLDARDSQGLINPKSLKIAQGWNFLSIHPWMKDMSLKEIKGTCDIEKAYIWSPDEQQWGDIMGAFSSDSPVLSDNDGRVGLGFIVKVSQDCYFEGGAAAGGPPPLPE